MTGKRTAKQGATARRTLEERREIAERTALLESAILAMVKHALLEPGKPEAG